jgi:hypothetical protein
MIEINRFSLFGGSGSVPTVCIVAIMRIAGHKGEKGSKKPEAIMKKRTRKAQWNTAAISPFWILNPEFWILSL